jgi:hypothetical protein
MDNTVRQAAQALNKGLDMHTFVASLDDTTKAALSTALLANLYPTFYDDWFWLCGHPIFAQKGVAIDRLVAQFGEIYSRSSAFYQALDITFAKVDPVTRTIEDDKARNTLVEVWLEAGPIEDVRTNQDLYSEEQVNYGSPSHDIDLDCGGTSFQEAIVKLAALVKKKYGDYTEEQACE